MFQKNRKLKKTVSFLVLLLALLLCLTACQTAPPEESETLPQNSEVPQSSETPNTTEPEGEGNETETPPVSPEEPLPKVKVFYSDEPVKVMDKSLYTNAFPYQTSYTAYLPVIAEEESRLGEGETLPVYYKDSSLITAYSEEEKNEFAKEFFSFLPASVVGTKTEDTSSGWMKYDFSDTTLRISVGQISIDSHPARAKWNGSPAEWISKEMEKNEYLKAVLARWNITQPKIVAEKIFDAFGEEHSVSFSISQKQESVTEQVKADLSKAVSVSAYFDRNSEKILVSIYASTWTPHAVLAEVPVLSYEDALKNLMSGNAFGTPEFAPQTEESVLACRVVYNNRAMNNAEIKDLGCVYFPVYEFTILQSPGDTGSPRTAYYYVPACNVSAELVAE